MGLTYRKEEQLRKMPKIESTITRSKDGRFIIQKTTITNVKPVEYYEAVLGGKEQAEAIELI